MKPSHLKPGTWLLISDAFGSGEYRARFEGRTPARGKGRPAVNHLFNPDWVALDGPDDRGIAVISDYELARRGRLLPPERPQHAEPMGPKVMPAELIEAAQTRRQAGLDRRAMLRLQSLSPAHSLAGTGSAESDQVEGRVSAESEPGAKQ